MKVINRKVWQDDRGAALLSKDEDGKFYVHIGSTTEGELTQLRDAITQALAEEDGGGK